MAPWYARRFGPAKPFKRRILTIESRADFEAAIDEYVAWRRQFCDESGELLPKFAPAPLVPSFLRAADDSEESGREAIPVPRGPVELW